MKRASMFPLFGVVFLSAQMLGAGEIGGDSDQTAVDTLNGTKYTTEAVSIAYDPAYSSEAADDASYVVLKKVIGFDTSAATTSTVTQCAAGASGTYLFVPSSSDPNRIRLLHVAYDANGSQIGRVLAADVAFPLATASGEDETFVDGRTNSLQICATEAEAAETVVTLPFAYDSKWPTNGVPASFRLTQVRDSVDRKMNVLSSETNVLVEAATPAVGDYSYSLNPAEGGRYTFFCTFFDGAGDVVGETYSASYYIKEKRGILILIK